MFSTHLAESPPKEMVVKCDKKKEEQRIIPSIKFVVSKLSADP
jgi:hypothetical protein